MDENKKADTADEEGNAALIKVVKDALGDKVSEVRHVAVSSRQSRLSRGERAIVGSSPRAPDGAAEQPVR